MAVVASRTKRAGAGTSRRERAAMRRLAWLVGLMLLVAAGHVLQNSIFRYFRRGVGGSLRATGEFSVSIGDALLSDVILPGEVPRMFGHRILKFGIPFSAAPNGCEFVYGAVIQHFEPGRFGNDFHVVDAERHLVRFEYDYKNLRCESKDLSIVIVDPPTSLVLQLVDVELGPETLTERPRPMGYRISIEDDELAAVAEEPIAPREPFRTVTVTKAVRRMSANLAPDEVRVALGPVESFGDLVHEQLARVTRSCLRDRHCPPVLIAVAHMPEVTSLALLDKAKAAGVPLDVITSYQPRAHKRHERTEDHARFAWWNWHRGNHFIGKLSGLLPMHAKFIVIGDELVIASDSNLTYNTRNFARNLTSIHRSPEVIAMYKAIFAMIRTAVTYQLEVDLRDNYVLLLNAERPRKYAATARRPFTPITTEEGVLSSAYGIVMKVFATVPGKIELFMSPLSDGCFRYSRRYCWSDLLRSRLDSGRLALSITAGLLNVPVDEIDPAKPLWYQPSIGAHLASKAKGLEYELARSYPQLVKVFSGRAQLLSVFHHRMALLPPDTVLGGAANLVYPYTLNLVELIRNPEIFRKVKLETKTFDEPYLALRRDVDSGTKDAESHGCTFVYNRPLGVGRGARPKYFRSAELLKHLRRRGFARSLDGVVIVAPTPASWMIGTPGKDRFLQRNPTPVFASHASHMCVYDTRTARSASVVLRGRRSARELRAALRGTIGAEK